MVPPPEFWAAKLSKWPHMGSPLRPTAPDLVLAERACGDFPGVSHAHPLRVLVLGVTPELAGLRWPEGTRLWAVDFCRPMIRGLWPDGRLGLPALAVCGDWRDMPVFDSSIDIAVGDGCYNVFQPPDGYRLLSAQVRRVLKPTGRVAMRFFVRPAENESLDVVFSDLLEGRVGNFDIFRWRLQMAVHGTTDEGTCQGDAWEVWNAREIDTDALAEKLGWSRAALATIDLWQGSRARLCFPTLNEVREALADDFVEIAHHCPDYELGDRCPALLLTPRA
ncbi:class I SAM-dependent methyltransferase [Candidatus Sumerlaeota bacterium]|nr:class I SAM-dependent methyltransferase [Candidatus Sumerlaeota bacterium]